MYALKTNYQQERFYSFKGILLGQCEISEATPNEMQVNNCMVFKIEKQM